MTKKLTEPDISEIFKRFKKLNPEPRGELYYTNPYTLLVAVILSARMTDKGVNKATQGLFSNADTPEKMLALGEEILLEALKTIGLYKNKAKNILKMSQILLEKHQGQVPQDRESLEALPGVGRKTANVVLNIAFHQPTIAVDTHLFRVSNRTGVAPGKTPLDVEKGLLEKVPESYRLHAHHWLILHGRYICQARKPLCFKCPISDICLYEPKTFKL